MNVSETFKSYLDLCRISNLPSIWSNVLCALLLATGEFNSGYFFLLSTSLSCFYLSGMCLNDICDAEHDRIHRPSRPIPSGRVSVREAGILTSVLLSAGLLPLLVLPHRQGLTAAFVLVVVIFWYDLHHKNNRLSVLLMAICRFLVYTVAATAITGTVVRTVIIAGLIQFCYVLAISLVARYENSRAVPFVWQVVPTMIGGICLVDGLVLAVFLNPWWLVAGTAGFIIMQGGQMFIRGD